MSSIIFESDLLPQKIFIRRVVPQALVVLGMFVALPIFITQSISWGLVLIIGCGILLFLDLLFVNYKFCNAYLNVIEKTDDAVIISTSRLRGLKTKRSLRFTDINVTKKETLLSFNTSGITHWTLCIFEREVLVHQQYVVGDWSTKTIEDIVEYFKKCKSS